MIRSTKILFFTLATTLISSCWAEECAPQGTSVEPQQTISPINHRAPMFEDFQELKKLCRYYEAIDKRKKFIHNFSIGAGRATALVLILSYMNKPESNWGLMGKAFCAWLTMLFAGAFIGDIYESVAGCLVDLFSKEPTCNEQFEKNLKLWVHKFLTDWPQNKAYLPEAHCAVFDPLYEKYLKQGETIVFSADEVLALINNINAALASVQKPGTGEVALQKA